MTAHAHRLAALGCGAACALLTAAGLTEPVEGLAYDGRMRLQPEPAALPAILVVAIDGESLGTVPWPWGRDVQAQLLDRLQGARAVLLDVLLADAGADHRADLALARALKRHGRVWLAVTADPDDGHRAVLPDITFLAAAKGLGSVSVQSDGDAIVRRLPLSVPLTAQSATAAGIVALPDATARQAVGSDRIAAIGLPIAREIRPDLPVPPHGDILPNFRRHPQGFDQVSAIAVLRGQVPPSRFRDRLVLVGATAEGLNDVHVLPVGKRFGIDYHAQVISSLVHGDWRQPLPAGVTPVLTAAAVIGSLLVWESLPAAVAALILAGAGGMLAAGDWLVWRHGQTWLPTATMVLASLLSLMAWGVGRQIALGWRLRRVIDDLVAAFQQRDVMYDSQTMLTAAAHPRRQPVSGQIRSLVGIAEAFHAEWRFLQALIETHRHPVLVVDPQQRLILSNSAGSALFGTQAAGASLPHLLSGMLDADGRSELAAAWQAVHDGAAEVTPPLIQHGHQALAVSFLPLTGGRGTLCLFEDVTALHRRANTDGLTGLWNRRYFDEKLAQEIARFHRYGQDHPVALILLDIDHFKQVNDAHGHPVGDQVLKLVAGTLQATVRTTDLAVRYGGEEMAVLLTHTDLEGAMILADRLRLAVTHLQAVDAAGRGFRVSASFGVAVSRPGDTPPALIARADKALYTSKTQGRNRVTAGDDGRSAGPDTDEET